MEGYKTVEDGQPLITIVVPSKNPGSDIWEFFKWAAPSASVEIVIVDDKSIDGSWEILQAQLAQLPAGALTLVRGEGQSAGAARNSGLSQARGEFVAFSDVDDWTHVPALLKAATLCRDSKADVVVCGYERLNLGSGSRLQTLPTWSSGIRGFEGAESLLDRAAVWGKVFRRSFLLENNVFFPVGQGAEDVRFSYEVARIRPRTLAFPEVAYEYRVFREGQLTGTRNYFLAGAKTLADMLRGASASSWERVLLAFTVLSSIPYVMRGIGGLRGTLEGLKLGTLCVAELGPVITAKGFRLGVRNRISRKATWE